jgi:hypothetical protein
VPISTWVQDVNNIPIFVNGRGDMGRAPFFNRTDLIVAHEFKMGETKRLRIEFNAENLFNQKTAEFVYNFYNRYRVRSSELNLAKVNLRNGYDWQAALSGTSTATLTAPPDTAQPYGAKDPRFGKEDNLRTGFAGRWGVKYIF